jgi:hypothetical protein
MNDTELSGALQRLLGHRRSRTTRYTATAAGTNAPIIAAVADARIVVTQAQITVGKGCSATEVQAIVGFGTTTTPTGDGVVASHAGAAPGGGGNRGDGSGLIGAGELGEGVLTTHDAPTGSRIDIVVTYFLVRN